MAAYRLAWPIISLSHCLLSWRGKKIHYVTIKDLSPRLTSWIPKLQLGLILRGSESLIHLFARAAYREPGLFFYLSLYSTHSPHHPSFSATHCRSLMQQEWRSGGSCLQKVTLDSRSREPQPENRRPQRAATREDVKGLVDRLKKERELNSCSPFLRLHKHQRDLHCDRDDPSKTFCTETFW